MHAFRFREFDLKSLTHATKYFVFVFDLLNKEPYKNTKYKKGTSLREAESFEPLWVKIRPWG